MIKRAVEGLDTGHIQGPLLVFVVVQSVVLLGSLAVAAFFIYAALVLARHADSEVVDASRDFLTNGLAGLLNVALLAIGLYKLLRRDHQTRVFWLGYFAITILFSALSVAAGYGCAAFFVLPYCFAWLAYWIWSKDVSRLFPLAS